jgi:hypothetical protein
MLDAHVALAWATIVVQWVPHILQLFGSVLVFVHVIPHSDSPDGQLDEHAYVPVMPAEQ